jgi:hypothetical protein
MWLLAFLRSSIMRLVPLTAHPRIAVADPGSGAHGADQRVRSVVGHAGTAYRDVRHHEVVDQLCSCCDGCGDGCVDAAGRDWVERQLTRRADRHVDQEPRRPPLPLTMAHVHATRSKTVR